MCPATLIGISVCCGGGGTPSVGMGRHSTTHAVPLPRRFSRSNLVGLLERTSLGKGCQVYCSPSCAHLVLYSRPREFFAGRVDPVVCLRRLPSPTAVLPRRGPNEEPAEGTFARHAGPALALLGRLASVYRDAALVAPQPAGPGLGLLGHRLAAVLQGWAAASRDQAQPSPGAGGHEGMSRQRSIELLFVIFITIRIVESKVELRLTR